MLKCLDIRCNFVVCTTLLNKFGVQYLTCQP